MKISYTTKSGFNPNEKLARAQLTDDNGRVNIMIDQHIAYEEGRNIEPDSIILKITFSKEVRALAYETLSNLDKELFTRYGLPNNSTELEILYVPYSKLATFYSSLLMLDPTITSQQMNELRNYFNPHKPENRQQSKQRFFEDPATRKKELLERFEAKKSVLDEGTINLINDLNAQPVSNEMVAVMRKTLAGAYHDFGLSDTPKLLLAEHLQQAKVDQKLVQNVYDGRYDNSPIAAKQTNTSAYTK